MSNSNSLFKRSLVFGIIILFIGAGIVPSMSGYTEKTSIQSTKEASTNFPLNNNYVNAYWKFDEGNGNIAYDSSGHDYDGTINGATWTTGHSGYALDFDGVNDYVDLNNYAQDKLGFNKTDDMIFSFWFKSSSTDSGIIFGMSNSPTYGYNPGVHIALNSNGKIEFKAWKTNCGLVLPSEGTYNDGDWHFVEIFYNGITANPTVEIYVDNELDISLEHWVCAFYSDQFHRAKIGERGNDSEINFDGVIDELKIIKYAGGNKQVPPTISGPTNGDPGVEYDYTFITEDPEGDDIRLWINWSDGTYEEWIGTYESGEEAIVSHAWSENGAYGITARSKDIWHQSRLSDPYVVKIGNQPPDKPTIDGPRYGDVEIEYDYTFVATDYEGNDIEYYIEWGDGTTEDWFGPFPSGEEATASHSWDSEGDFSIRAKTRDYPQGNEGDWSDPYHIRIGDEAPNAPDISGPSTGVPNEQLTFTFKSVDPEGDDVYFDIEWGDGASNTNEGPYESGEEAPLSHSWSDQGEYEIRARARDTFNASSSWETFPVTIPRSKAFNFDLLEWFFERFPQAFPVIRHLLNL